MDGPGEKSGFWDLGERESSLKEGGMKYLLSGLMMVALVLVVAGLGFA